MGDKVDLIHGGCDVDLGYELSVRHFVNMISKIFIFAVTLSLSNAGWGSSNDPGKVLLRDVQVLTLKSGQMTTGMYLLSSIY